MRYRSRLVGLVQVLLVASQLLAAAYSCSSDGQNVTIAGYRCVCDERFEPDNKGGWYLGCYQLEETNPHNLGFNIEYIERTEVVLQCDIVSPLIENLYENFSFPGVKRFKFKYCNKIAENLTYAQVLGGVKEPILTLSFVGCDLGEELSISQFGNFSDLSILMIQRSKNLQRINETFFRSMPRLTMLEISSTNVSSIPEKLFWPLVNLTQLNIGVNGITELPPKLFVNQTNLVGLYLYQNKITKLHSDQFSGLKSLRQLDIYDNKIEELPFDVFYPTVSLKQVRISNLSLRKLPETLFSKCLDLGDLNMNRLTHLTDGLPANLLKGLDKLENITLNQCNLSSIPDTFFSNARNLKRIGMQENRLTSISKHLFNDNSKLISIDMSYNDVTSLTNESFSTSYNLEDLNLFSNNIVTIENGVFDNLINLRKLILENNDIISVDKNAFSGTRNLRLLNLKNNNITKLNGNMPFGQNQELTKIIMSNNKLTDLSSSINWLVYKNLVSIDFRNNSIESFSVPRLLSDRTEMFLQNNQIKRVEIDNLVKQIQYDASENLRYSASNIEHKYYLGGNPFLCDCKIFDFIKYLRSPIDREEALFVDRDTYSCAEPEALKSKKLLELKNNQLSCAIKDDCPTSCHCSFQPERSTTIVNCSNASLSQFPMQLPNETNVLILTGNDISVIPDISMWTSIRSIDLSNNTIESLPEMSQLPEKLESLILTHNNIHNITHTWMDNFTLRAFNLQLSENPWVCNCSTLRFKQWLQENYAKIPDNALIRCKEPIDAGDGSKADTIIKIEDSVYCPIDTSAHKKQLVAVTVICVVLAILLLLVSILYYRNRQTLIAYVYIHWYKVFICFFSEEDLDEDKRYDAFVSYSSQDADVAMKFIEILEGKQDDYKLCVHERDWLPGYNISWNIVNSVQNSRRTILVISEAFLQSLWFQVEFRTAYYQMLEDRVDRLIVIIKGDLPAKDTMDKDLRFLLNTKTYLVWGERWFWEKLRYAMPHRKHAEASKDVPMSVRHPPSRTAPNSHVINIVEDQIAQLTNAKNHLKERNGVHKTETAAADAVITQQRNHSTNNNGSIRRSVRRGEGEREEEEGKAERGKESRHQGNARRSVRSAGHVNAACNASLDDVRTDVGVTSAPPSGEAPVEVRSKRHQARKKAPSVPS